MGIISGWKSRGGGLEELASVFFEFRIVAHSYGLGEGYYNHSCVTLLDYIIALLDKFEFVFAPDGNLFNTFWSQSLMEYE